MDSIRSFDMGVDVGDGLSMPARLAELLRAMLLMATPSAPGFGWIAISERTTNIISIMSLTLFSIFLSESFIFCDVQGLYFLRVPLRNLCVLYLSYYFVNCIGF